MDKMTAEEAWKDKYETMRQMALIMYGAMMAANTDKRFDEVISTVCDTIFEM